MVNWKFNGSVFTGQLSRLGSNINDELTNGSTLFQHNNGHHANETALLLILQRLIQPNE